MIRLRLRLPHWTAHPGFGVAVLLVLAVVLIAHGEPQPSSRPSGTSVGVSGTATAAGAIPPLLVLRTGRVELREHGSTRRIGLPSGARPRSVISGRGLSVVLAVLGERQHAYAIDANHAVHDLGYADGAIRAETGSAAVIVETALTDPGLITAPDVLPEPGRTSPVTTAGGTGGRTSGSEQVRPSPTPTEQPALRNFSARRYDGAARPLGSVVELPPATRLATDSSVGLVVWQPANRVFDAGVALEPLSAAATLIRPDGSLRPLGPVHPLAANTRDLLVWDVVGRRFGLMPLSYVTSTATSTASPSHSPTDDASASGRSSRSATPSPTPTAVAGVRWFQPTRGMIVVTGPASFNADGTAFAVYAQVGSRRRLVVAELTNLGTDQVEVLALVRAAPQTSASPSPSAVITPGSVSGSGTPTKSPSPTATPSIPALEPDGFPIPAPLTPMWWNDLVVAVGVDGAVIGYRPGGHQSSQLDLGMTGIRALAAAP